MKKILAVLLAAVMVCSMAVVGFAATWESVAAATPTYDQTQNIFFANGTPITVKANPDNGNQLIVTWAGGQETISSGANIFGGGDGSADGAYKGKKFASSITVESGNCFGIFGGGYLDNAVGTSNVLIKGGSFGNAVCGGGLASASNDGSVGTAADSANSPNRVDVANVTMENGSSLLLFGGGQGYSSVGTANLTVKGGDWGWVTGGGSNGYTGTANVLVQGGEITVLQSVNRGSMDSASMEMTGGTVDNFYLGGETADSGVTGAIGKVDASVTGGTVTNLEAGTNGGLDMADPDNAQLAQNTVTRVEAADGVVANDNTGDSITVEDAPLWTGDSDSYTATDNDANTTETQDAIRAGEDVSVEIHNPANAISLKTMNLLGANSGASLTVSIGDMSVTIPGGFGTVTEAGRVYYPMDYRSPAKAASEMEKLAGGADCEAVEAGAPMTMPTAVTVTLETDLEGTVHVYLYSEDSGKLTYVASPAEDDGTVTFTATRLGCFLLSGEKL